MFQRGPRYCYLALAFLLAAVSVAEAPSFECGKASTDIENAICRDPALSQLDGELGAAFRSRLEQDPCLHKEQIPWVRERNKRCGPDVAGPTREQKVALEGSLVAATAELALRACSSAGSPPSHKSLPAHSGRKARWQGAC